MTTTYEERPKTITEKWCVKRICDLCGKEAVFPDQGNWEATTTYDVSKVEISVEEGSSFPEGASKEKTQYDVCPTCFKEVVAPFLESKGAKARKTNTGW